MGLVNSLKITVIIFVISVLFLIFIKIKNKESFDEDDGQNDRKDLLQIIIFGTLAFLSIIIISKLSYKFVYVRYLYHMIPLFITVAVMFAEWLVKKFKLSKAAVFCILTAFSILNAAATINTNDVSYIFSTTQDKYNSIYQEYSDVPVVLLSYRKTYVMTANYHFLKNYSDVYIMPKEDLNKIDSILKEKTTEDGIILMIWTDKVWSDGYDGKSVLNNVKKNCTLFDDYEKLTEMNFCKVYYLSNKGE